MKRNRRRICFFLTILFFLFCFQSLANAEGTSLTPEGIKFPDGSVQTTKAVETGIPGPEGPQGPKGDPGPTIKVYSNTGEFLGILLEGNAGVLSIFIPSLRMTCSIDSSDTPGYSDIQHENEYFESSNCTGTAYCGASNGKDIVGHEINRKFDGSYVTPVKVLEKEIHSIRYRLDYCDSTSILLNVYEVVPIETLPFTTPIKLPLTFEYK